MRLADERGYSLMEMIAVMAILGIVLGSLTTLFVSGSKAELGMNSRFEAQNTARLALDRLRRDVHCATSATSTGTSVTLTYALTACLGQSTVTWCTNSVAGSTSRYTLNRQTGATACSATSNPYADYLISSSVFTYEPASTENLAKLRANLQVRRPNMETPVTLCDTLVLRNSTRTGADVDPAIACA